MGTLGNTDIGVIYTMTSPDSRKALNILENPKIEWMFTDKKLRTVIHLKCKARVIHEEAELKMAWDKLKDKSRAYFMKFIKKTGMAFLLIETKVEEIEYSRPADNVYKMIRPPFR